MTVTDAQGNFVTGLTADDFEVFEDGKPQTIQTFSYIELPVERRTDRYRSAASPVPADVRSNRDVSSGRVYIIVLDDLNVAPLRTNIVRRHAREFIEQPVRTARSGRGCRHQRTQGRGAGVHERSGAAPERRRHFFGQRLQSAEMQRIDDYYRTSSRTIPILRPD